MNFVQTVNKNDVLSGRGHATNQHTGNIIFRQMVASKREAYSAACIRRKREITDEVVAQITSNRGRFLSQTEANGLRQVLSLKEIKKKTAQALREQPRNNEATEDKAFPTQQDDTGPASPFYHPQREESKNNVATDDRVWNSPQDIDSIKICDHHLDWPGNNDRFDDNGNTPTPRDIDTDLNGQFDNSFDLSALNNGSDSNLSNSIVNALMASCAGMSIDAFLGLQSSYREHEDGGWNMGDVCSEAKDESIGTSTIGIHSIDVSDRPWSTSLH